MQTPDPVVSHRQARALLSAGRAGVLSTLSRQMDGFPFGSVAPYCLDRRGWPVILVSDIAQHTRNLLADPRVCLTVLEPGDDVQTSGRLSVLARGVPVEGEGTGMAERYYRYFPASRGYHRVHGFRFFALEPVRVRWIGGFGDIHWIEPAELFVPNPFSDAEESAIIDHMNADHERAVRGYWERIAEAVPAEAELALVGIDAEGLDLRSGDRVRRLVFDEPVRTTAEARERLVALAHEGTAAQRP